MTERVTLWLIHKLGGYTKAERNDAYALGWRESKDRNDPTTHRWLRATIERDGDRDEVIRSYVGNQEYSFWDEQGLLDVRMEIAMDAKGYEARLVHPLDPPGDTQ